MLPQVGPGGGTPRPRKDSALSAGITQPSMEVASTVSGETMCGRTCRQSV